MKETKFIRKGKTIQYLDQGNKRGKTFDSINLAKKESHKLQMSEDGALGRGSLQVAYYWLF